jgi:hypothetical protein
MSEQKAPTPPPDEAWMQAMAAVHGLTIEPAWTANVQMQLSIIRQIAGAVLSGPVDDVEDTGPVFRP